MPTNGESITFKDPVLTSNLCSKEKCTAMYKVTCARTVGWNNSLEIGNSEISNFNSRALSKLTGYSFENLLWRFVILSEKKHALMHAAKRKHGIEIKSACGNQIPKPANEISSQDVGIPLFSGGLENIHKDLWDF